MQGGRWVVYCLIYILHKCKIVKVSGTKVLKQIKELTYKERKWQGQQFNGDKNI